MDKRTLKALQGSIKKWESIVAGVGKDLGGNNCALCIAFPSCDNCPVIDIGGGTFACDNTPYDDWAKSIEFKSGGMATTDQQVRAAQAELDFLKSLLPEGQT